MFENIFFFILIQIERYPCRDKCTLTVDDLIKVYRENHSQGVESDVYFHETGLLNHDFFSDLEILFHVKIDLFAYDAAFQMKVVNTPNTQKASKLLGVVPCQRICSLAPERGVCALAFVWWIIPQPSTD